MEVLDELAELYQNDVDDAQDEVNQTREHHGQNFILSILGFSNDVEWDTNIEASSVGDASVPSEPSVLDLSSDD